MEGMAGFGTAVAISASILCGLGISPIFAATVCLVANATPTAFGSIGIPTITAASVSGLDPRGVAVAVVMQLAVLVVLTPFLMMIMTGGSAQRTEGDRHDHTALRTGIYHSGIPHCKVWALNSRR